MARANKPGHGEPAPGIPGPIDKAPRRRAAARRPAVRRGTNKRPGRLLAAGCAFTEEIRAAIIGGCEAGRPRKYAAAQVGISERTIQRWVSLGRDNLAELDDAEGVGEPDAYGAFLQRLIQAEAYARGKHLDKILASKDWRARAWYLERVDSRQFGTSTKIEPVMHDDRGEEINAADMLLDKLADMTDRRKRYSAHDDDEAPDSGGAGD